MIVSEVFIWLLTGVIALVGSSLLCVVYAAAWFSLKKTTRIPIGEPILISAWANYRREVVRAITLVLFTLAGIVSLVNTMSGPYEHTRIVTLSCLVLGHIFIAVNIWCDWLDYQKQNSAVDAWDQEYVAVRKTDSADQLDRMEATQIRMETASVEALDRLRRSSIGERKQALVDQQQATEIQNTGEDTNRRVREQQREERHP